MGALGTLFLPLRRYAVFRGRSMRFELILFVLLLALIRIGIGYTSWFLSTENVEWGQRGFILLIFCPLLALMIRRLHDTGRSGRWLVIGLPLLGFLLWELAVQIRDPLAQSPIDAMPVLARVALALTGVVIAVLLLWDADEGGNEYGPDPRAGLAEVAV
jgi:uncharacterized membrane protein YhaH (DUF805 family)